MFEKLASMSHVKNRFIAGSPPPHLRGKAEHPSVPKANNPCTINPSVGRSKAAWTKWTL